METSSHMLARAERYVPRDGAAVSVRLGKGRRGRLSDISKSGLGALFRHGVPNLSPGDRIAQTWLGHGGKSFPCGSGEIVRVEERKTRRGSGWFVGIRFDSQRDPLLTELSDSIRPPCPSSRELRAPRLDQGGPVNALTTTIDRFYAKGGPDILAKCSHFQGWMDDMMNRRIYQRLYRLTVTGPLDRRISVFDPEMQGERSMICFDSNSYLGLHLHPRVIERTMEVMQRVGYGTASAQLLCGTNRYLCELEEALSDFHGRQATLVFPSGFAANIGILTALVRKTDALLWDRFAHASIQEGCRTARAGFGRTFEHNDMASLEARLMEAQHLGSQGKLVATDGVFSMHGRLAPLPELVELCGRYGARLMVDDAHGLGVLGQTGGGTEEHFGIPGRVDVLMGTLSKSLGAVGGYVTGSRELIDYLRFFAPSGMFTTTLPAATCAGLTEALRLVRAEPEHRQRLWENINWFVPALRDRGLLVSEAVSPIVTVFVGDQGFMYRLSGELSDAGIKCGNVAYPAMAKGESILRFTLNARHTREDLEIAVDTLGRLGKKLDILGRTREQILEIGRGVASASAA